MEMNRTSRDDLAREVELQARELRLLNEMRRALVGAYDLPTIYQAVVANIYSNYNSAVVGIYQLVDDKLILQGQAGATQFAPVIGLGEGRIGRVALTGKGVLLTDLAPENKIGYKTTSAIYTPLLGPGYEVLGTLVIESDENYDLNERDYKICEALAEHVTLAVAQALAYEREKLRLSQLSLLNHVGRDLASSLEINEIIERVTGPIRHNLNFYNVNIGLVEGNFLVFKNFDGTKLRYNLQQDKGLGVHAARTGELVICHDVSQEPRFLPNAAMPNTRAEVVIPLKSSSEIIGVLNVESDGTTTFDDDTIILLKTLADQTGIALTNARHFADLKRQSEILNDSNRQLAEANRLKSEFLANVSHELRTPLNSIIGYVDMVQSGFYGDVPADMDDPLERVLRNGKRLLGLINDMLDMTSLEAGRVQLIMEEVLTYEVIGSLANINRPDVEEKGLEFFTEVLSGTPRIIRTDLNRLRQIVNILLSNAVKFTHEGCITLKAAPALLNEKPAFSILVSDTGIGIPPEEIENIFEQFRQVDGSSTRQYAGTGLGLALARRLVYQMNGQMSVSSELNKGSTFTVTFPIRD
jgi:signal transduction histidine kinase